MTKKIQNILFAIIFCLPLFAKPAYNGVIKRTQADGSTIDVVLHGDEHFHYMTDTKGNWLKKENGMYVQTEAMTAEELTTRRKAGKFDKAQNAQASSGAYLAPRGLVILANFSDAQFKAENNQAAFDSLLNVEGYTYHGQKGSVRDYFIFQSDSQYAPVFDVYGPVEVNHAIAYYGTNDSQGYDTNAEQLIVDACHAAKSDYDINFADYDNDNDGFVDFVFVFYAGYGEADGADESTIWQHMYKLYDYAGINCRIDNKRVNLYACGSELSYYVDYYKLASNARDGINTCCHEFSHVCGLPDLYDTQSGTKTLGQWDLMDSGTSNNYGWTPPYYSAYERFFCGWLTPTLINTACDVNLPRLFLQNQAVIMTTTGEHNMNGYNPNPKTFYLLENRQQQLNDKYLPGHGLLITKITYNATNWSYNNVNSSSAQGVEIQVADGKKSKNGDSGDTYPGAQKVTSFSKITNYAITDIAESNFNITFSVNGGGDLIDLDIKTALNNTAETTHSIVSTQAGIEVRGCKENELIEVFDLSGKLIHSTIAKDETTQLSLERNVYIVKIGSESKVIMH